MVYNFDGLSFQILTMDRFFHNPGFYNVNARPYAALSLRVSGIGSFEIGGKRFVSAPGDVLFLPADTPYKVEYSVSESIVVHFSDSNYFNAENISLNNPSRIDHQFHHLLLEWGQNHSINQAKSMIYDIFEKISIDQKMSIKDTAIANCIRYLEENFCDHEINIKAVCEVAFVTASTLQRGFAKYVGISPQQYLIHLRMNRAIELLTENELSIKEIAASCGFEDEKYFSRAFKKNYGSSPSQFRKHLVT